jgi:Tfp pilus assembly protein PilN
MPQINLLEWRQQALRLKRTRFWLLALSVSLVAFIILLIFHIYYATVLSAQLERNHFLETQISNEQAQLNALMDQKRDMAKVDADLHFLMNLRRKSYQAVELLDAITRATPEDITVNKIIRNGSDITIDAKANFNSDISILMERLAKMTIFNQPILTVITEKEDASGNNILFEIKLYQKG